MCKALNEEIIELIRKVQTNLLEDLPQFLLNPKDFKLSEKIDRYCSDALSELEGKMESGENFSMFIDILYGCQQLDDFGEAWAPTEKKVQAWIDFLKKFKN